MQVKRYEANTLQEALYKVKLDLGPEAVILYIKDIRHYGFLYLTYMKKVEVIAGLDEKPTETVNNTKLEMIQYDLRQIKDFMKGIVENGTQTISRTSVMPPALRALYDRMMNAQIDEEAAEALTQSVGKRVTERELVNPGYLEEVLIRQIAQEIEVSGPLVADGNKIVAFVGPTGVGKTTTVAKIAANFTLLEKKKVALITLDTYRIAAVEQLKTYAEIMGIPIEVVFTPRELIPAINRHKEKDLILIDTAGRNPLNDAHMDELKQFLGQDGTIEVQLLISMTTNTKEIAEILGRFELAKVHRLILTKLDEVTHFGSVLTVARLAKRPISYVTTGQNVPEDMELADPLKLARLIVSSDRTVLTRKAVVAESQRQG